VAAGRREGGVKEEERQRFVWDGAGGMGGGGHRVRMTWLTEDGENEITYIVLYEEPC
jgi:hypothetical protein